MASICGLKSAGFPSPFMAMVYSLISSTFPSIVSVTTYRRKLDKTEDFVNTLDDRMRSSSSLTATGSGDCMNGQFCCFPVSDVTVTQRCLTYLPKNTNLLLRDKIVSKDQQL